MSRNTQTRAEIGGCYMVALDHRGSLVRALEHLGADSGAARCAELKYLVWRGVKQVLDGRLTRRSDLGAAMLIDRGQRRIAEEAAAGGMRVAVALEASGQRSLRAEAAPSRLAEDLRALGATYGKVLVRWHPHDSAPHKHRQLAALRRLDDIVRGAGAELLLELLVPADPDEGATTTCRRSGREGSSPPDPAVRAAEEILASGIVPTVWKIERPRDTESARAFAALVTSADPHAAVLVLGGGAPVGDLPEAFAPGAGIEQFRGFAVGRSIWWPPLEALTREEITPAQARRAVGDNYVKVIDAFEAAACVAVQPC
jgi:5-dehydro-2-deoxygluconokinase